MSQLTETVVLQPHSQVKTVPALGLLSNFEKRKSITMNNEIWIHQHDLSLCDLNLAMDANQVAVAAYLRTANIDERTEDTLMAQAQAIRYLCNKQFTEGCSIIWVTDRGASGALPYKQPELNHGQYRTGLTVLTQLIEQGCVQHVCVHKLSNLTTTLRTWIDFKREYIDKHGVQMLFATEVPAASQGFLNNICVSNVALANKHSASIVHNQVNSHSHTKSETPYGWQYRAKGIEPVAAEAVIVQQIIGEFLNGQTTSQIAQGLTLNNVLSPGSAHKWSSRTVRSLLSCPIHYGLVKSIDGSLAYGEHYDKRLYDESIYKQVIKKFCRKG
jgi:hypothetical protein